MLCSVAKSISDAPDMSLRKVYRYISSKKWDLESISNTS